MDDESVIVKKVKLDLDKDLYPELDYLLNHTESDVQFLIDGQSFPAHKLLMSAKSDVFRSMFSGQWQESVDNKVEIRDTTPDAFKVMMVFIYTERLVFSNDNDLDHIRDVLKLGDRYQLKRLIKTVEQSNKPYITVRNIQLIGRLAFDYKLDELIGRLKRFIDNNLKELMNKPESEVIAINSAVNDLLIKSFRQYFLDIKKMFSQQPHYVDGNYHRYKIGEYTCNYQNNSSGTVKVIDIQQLPNLEVDSMGVYYRYLINGETYSYSDSTSGKLKYINL
ncbi:uncharacterized protein LOC128952486 [Oppia nitens]|uniref:uncharacterized protein LOC128952486 n=1 Tax=Oppia nitens TaxID=1686743 RepID=UPI0023DC72E7|nr:uncharacterized protein LOC128952486 [Oppia nitens]